MWWSVMGDSDFGWTFEEWVVPERREGRDIRRYKKHMKEALRSGSNYDWDDSWDCLHRAFLCAVLPARNHSSQPLPTPYLVTFLLFFQSLALTTPSGSFLCLDQVKCLFLWKCFIVMHLPLIVRIFNLCRSYSLISIRTGVVSVFSLNCVSSTPWPTAVHGT